MRIPWTLIVDFSRREIEKKYRGSYLGILWVFVEPFLLLGIYTFVYAYILRVKVPDLDSVDFVIWLYAGLTIFIFFADVITTATPSIRNSPNYVKKVIFPLEVLVTSKLISALFSFAANFLLLVIFVLLKRHTLYGTIFFTPLVLLPAVIFVYGVAMILASFGVFIRDIDGIVRPALRVLFYLTPIVYPQTLVPGHFFGFMWLNPLTIMVDSYRRIMVFGTAPEWDKLALFFVASLAVLYLSTLCFNKLRPAFADVV